uniref:Alternative oxidase n=1 Tax=Urechis unicinctus TaxID=6432 RepID=H2BDK1_UREUN|nr:alternative oxidase [Urechis unicinctus]
MMARVTVRLLLAKDSHTILSQAVRQMIPYAASHNALITSMPQVYAYSTQTRSLNNKAKESVNLGPHIQENLKKFREGSHENVSVPEELQHFRKSTEEGVKGNGPEEEKPPMGAVALPHPIWSEEELHSVHVTHRNPEGIVDKIAYMGVKFTRGCYDFVSGYSRGRQDEKMWVSRLCFLETVAGVPGMVAAMVRHLTSLRKMRRDHGWIHTLLEEAENERMHLMVMLQLKQPSLFFRLGVMVTQGVFVSGFSVAYMLSPRLCHRFVGYLEEEAVITYTKLLKEIDSGAMQHWNTLPGPDVAISYWKLRPGAAMKDVILAIRADEAHHRVVNHTLSSLKDDDYNPYKPGQ